MRGIVKSLEEAEWKANLFGLGSVYCWSISVGFWLANDLSVLSTLVHLVGILLATLWFFINFYLLKEEGEIKQHLRKQLDNSEYFRRQAEARVSELEGIIEKARARSQERRNRNNQKEK